MTSPTTHTRVLAHVRDAWCCPTCGSVYSIGAYVGNGMTLRFECDAGHTWKLYASDEGHAVEWAEQDDA